MKIFAVLTLFLGYVSALPVYPAPARFGGKSGWRNHNNGMGMANGPGGTVWDGEIVPRYGGRGGTAGRGGTGLGGTGGQGRTGGLGGKGRKGAGGGGEGAVRGGFQFLFLSSSSNAESEGEGNGIKSDEVSSHVSSSASDYDSTPSDGGGDTNPTTPTLPPGGDPTTINPAHPLKVRSGGVRAVGIVLALGLVVGVCIVAAVYVVKRHA